MRPHGALRGLRIAGGNGLEDAVVFGKAGMRLGWAGRAAHDRGVRDGTPDVVQLVEEQKKQRVVRGLRDRAVEEIVPCFVIRPISGLFRGIAGYSDPRDRVTRGVNRGFPGQRRFDAKPGLHHAQWRDVLAEGLDQPKVARGLAVGQKGAFAHMPPDHTAPFQRVQCLSQRVPSDAQGRNHLALGRQTVTVFVAAAINEILQAASGLLGLGRFVARSGKLIKVSRPKLSVFSKKAPEYSRLQGLYGSFWI